MRTRLTRLFLPGPHAPDRAARIQALKDEILRDLDIRRDFETGMIVPHFELSQLAFRKTPLMGLPENSQIYKSELIHPAAFEASPGQNCAAHQLATVLGI